MRTESGYRDGSWSRNVIGYEIAIYVSLNVSDAFGAREVVILELEGTRKINDVLLTVDQDVCAIGVGWVTKEKTSGHTCVKFSVVIASIVEDNTATKWMKAVRLGYGIEEPFVRCESFQGPMG